MEKAINGTLYDTEKAKGIVAWVTEYVVDPQPGTVWTVPPEDDGQFPMLGFWGNDGSIEKLFKTSKNAFMLHVLRFDFEDLIPMSDAEALAWCEQHSIDADVITANFKVEAA